MAFSLLAFLAHEIADAVNAAKETAVIVIPAIVQGLKKESLSSSFSKAAFFLRSASLVRATPPFS